MDEIKSDKSLPFSVKKSEFPVWKFKFLACCAYQNCEEILLDPQALAPGFAQYLDPADPIDMILIEGRKQNGKAYMLLGLSTSPSDTITFNAAQNAVSADLPSGDAKQSWKNINEVNQPATKADLHDLEQQFNHCVLKDETQKPDKCFSKLENLRILLKLDHQKIIDDNTMITQILYNPNF
jgi:hypothetical protein